MRQHILMTDPILKRHIFPFTAALPFLPRPAISSCVPRYLYCTIKLTNLSQTDLINGRSQYSSHWTATNLPTAGLDLRLVDSVFKYAYIGYTSTYLYCAHTLI